MKLYAHLEMQTIEIRRFLTEIYNYRIVAFDMVALDMNMSELFELTFESTSKAASTCSESSGRLTELLTGDGVSADRNSVALPRRL